LQGYLGKKLHIRKRSTLPNMGDGAFIELEKLYNLDQPNAAFHGDPKQRAKEALIHLDALLKELENGGGSLNSSSSSNSSSNEHEKDPNPWSQVEDPSSGSKYWYNSVTGASQWEDPNEI
jgi:hypothetical protein